MYEYKPRNYLLKEVFYILLSEVSYYLNNNAEIPVVTCQERILFFK
jgi:hypothetical protein